MKPLTAFAPVRSAAVHALLSQFARWLVDPPSTVTQPQQRVQAALIARMLLITAGLAGLALLITGTLLWQDRSPFTHALPLIGICGLLVWASQLARRASPVQAFTLVCVGISLMIALTALISGGERGMRSLYMFVALMLFGVLFLEMRVLLRLALLHTVLLLTAPLYIAGADPEAILRGPVWLLLTLWAITIGLAHYHQRMDRLHADAIAAERERYRQLIETMIDPVLVTALDGTVLHLNEQARLITGLRDGDGLAERAGDFMLPASAAIVRSWFTDRDTLPIVSGRYQVALRHALTGRTLVYDLKACLNQAAGQPLSLTFVGRDITDREDYEARLRESEERYRTLSELASDYMLCIRWHGAEDYRVEWVTASVVNVLGYTAEEMREQSAFWPVHPDDRPRMMADRSAIFKGETRTGDYRVLTKSGQYRWVRMVRTRAEADTGFRIYVSVKDIHAQKEAELALAASEKRYRIVSSMMTDYAACIHLTSPTAYTVEWITDSVRQVLGYSLEELLSMEPHWVTHPDDIERLLSDREAAMRGETHERFYRVRVKSGEYRWMRFVRRPVMDDDGTRIYISVQDIHDHKLAADALAASEERYRILAEMVSDYAICIHCTPSGAMEVAWATDSIRQVLGIDYEDIRHTTRIDLVHEDDRQRFVEDWSRAVMGEDLTAEYRINVSADHERWVQVSYRSVRAADGGTYIYNVGRDVTQRVLMERAQLQAAIEIERYRTISRLITSVSHDFRTHLSTIETSRYLAQRLLERGGLLPQALPVIEKLTAVQSAVRHIAQQIDNIMLIAAAVDQQIGPVNLHDLLEFTYQAFSGEAQQKGVQLYKTIPPNLPPIKGSYSDLRRALENLLRNALTHTPTDGQIRLIAEWHDDRITLQVSDTGSGIPAQHLPHLFEPFYRTDEARSTALGGVGIGLTIVKVVTTVCGGSVAIASTEGQGTTVTLTFPVLHDELISV